MKFSRIIGIFIMSVFLYGCGLSAEQWQQIGEFSSDLNDSLYETSSSSSSEKETTYQVSEPRNECFKTDEYISGDKKFCVYNCGGREHIETAPGYYFSPENAFCPFEK